jgi:adenosylcobyric acid synthase
MGSYLHGVFATDAFRRAFLQKLGAEPSTFAYDAGIEETLTLLAAHIEAHLDVDGLLRLAR